MGGVGGTVRYGGCRGGEGVQGDDLRCGKRK